MVKNPGAKVRSLGREDPHGEENDNPFQYSCLGNPKDGGVKQAIVHKVPVADMT